MARIHGSLVNAGLGWQCHSSDWCHHFDQTCRSPIDPTRTNRTGAPDAPSSGSERAEGSCNAAYYTQCEKRDSHRAITCGTSRKDEQVYSSSICASYEGRKTDQKISDVSGLVTSDTAILTTSDTATLTTSNATFLTTSGARTTRSGPRGHDR